jgi:chorismate dehydratase
MGRARRPPRATSPVHGAAGTSGARVLARVARIPYLNAAPFYLLLDGAGVRSVELPPRRMGEAARAGEVDAGPFSLLDYLALIPSFRPLGDFCIAVKRAAGSVLLFSRGDPASLTASSVVALDPASTTGAALARVLLGQRLGVSPRFVREAADPDARLLIGDAALAARFRGLPGYPRVLDLGEAWWAWHRLPFVFAVWAIRAPLADSEGGALADLIGRSVRRWMDWHESGERYAEWGARLGLPAAALRDYLAGFIYRMGEDEREAVKTFRACVERLPAGAEADAAAR